LNRTEEFEQLRALLFAIAYRILGSVGEAEDAVQEDWLRSKPVQAARRQLAGDSSWVERKPTRR
jgi:DNA-directed RNA polymerase specialized sigma24 family protein